VVSDQTIDLEIYRHEAKRREHIRKWRESARVEQIPPEQDWYIRGGRGSGKTWTGSHTLAEWVQRYPGRTWAVVAPTYADARDKCIEGVSGLIAALGTTKAEIEAGRSRLVRSWNRSLHDLRLRDGGTVWADGADDGAPTIQGENLAGVWADEVGLWSLNRWEMAWKESLEFALRVDPARFVATGTPKRGHPLVKRLMSDDSVAKTVMKTMDNADNLSPDRLQKLIDAYGGTTIGRQELEGEFFEESAGALWSRDVIQYRKVPGLSRVVVAIDPAATSGVSADETGIVAAGRDAVGLGYVLDDASLRGTPDEWGRAAVRLYHRLEADMIVAESNNGGEMVQHVIKTVDPSVHVKLVHASRGKVVRAQPVSAKYEQNRIYHAEAFPALEDQMVSWTPIHEASNDKSPDRVDALVWAMTELMIEGSWGGGHGGIV
jgi:phage terminase large subunit-like protein